MTFYALKHTATGQYMPDVAGARQRACTHWEPTRATSKPGGAGPRLFRTRHAARCARAQWAKGALTWGGEGRALQTLPEPVQAPPEPPLGPTPYGPSTDTGQFSMRHVEREQALSRAGAGLADGPQYEVNTQRGSGVNWTAAPLDPAAVLFPQHGEWGDPRPYIQAGSIQTAPAVPQGWTNITAIAEPPQNRLGAISDHTRSVDDLEIVEVEVVEVVRNLLTA